MTQSIVVINGGFNGMRHNTIDHDGFVFLWQNGMYVTELIDPQGIGDEIIARKLDSNYIPGSETFNFFLKKIDMRRGFFRLSEINAENRAYIVGKMEKKFSKFVHYSNVLKAEDKNIEVGHVLVLERNSTLRILIKYASEYRPGKYFQYYRHFESEMLGPARRGHGTTVYSRDFLFEEQGARFSYDHLNTIRFEPMLLVGKMDWQWVFQEKWELPSNHREFKGVLSKEQAECSF